MNAGSSNLCGTNNVFLGYGAVGSTANSSNTITLGNASITTIRANVGTISALSDCRDKTNITGIPIGLNFIKEVNPVKFTWDRRDGTKTGVNEFGFIAQELDALQTKYNVQDTLDLVLKDNPDSLEATPGKLLPVLVKAIQDLSLEIDVLKNHVSKAQVVDTIIRDAIPAENGQLVYNSDVDKFQGYANGTWVNLSL